MPELTPERSHVYGSLGQVSREREMAEIWDRRGSKWERGREDEFPRQNGVQKKVLLAIRLPTYKLTGREEGGRDGLSERGQIQSSNMTLPNYSAVYFDVLKKLWKYVLKGLTEVGLRAENSTDC